VRVLKTGFCDIEVSREINIVSNPFYFSSLLFFWHKPTRKEGFEK